jgi:uncharacterized protein (DUF885 family)
MRIALLATLAWAVENWSSKATDLNGERYSMEMNTALYDIYYAISPGAALYFNNHEFIDRWEDYSLAGFTLARKKLNELIDGLKLEPERSLNSNDLVTRQVVLDALQYKLSFLISEYAYYMPCYLAFFNPNTCVPLEIAAMGNPSNVILLSANKQILQAYISKLAQVPMVFDHMIEAYKAGIKAKRTLTIMETQNLILGCTNITSSLGSLSVFESILKDYDLPVVGFRQTMVENVIPAAVKLRSFLQGEYLPHASPNRTAFFDTKEVYEKLVQFHTTISLSAQQVHDIGLQEVARIENLMEKSKNLLGFNGTLQEFQKSLQDKTKYPMLYADSDQQILNEYRKVASNIEKLLPEYFGRLPNGKLEVAPTNEGMGFYSNGKFFVNVKLKRNRPMHDKVAQVLHQGIPGHHLDLQLVKEAPKRHDFYRAFRVGSHSEGWAVYAEHLGEIMNVYSSDTMGQLDYFGKLEQELSYAVRMVVDSGIHAFRWSEERALSYMLSKLSYTREEAMIAVQLMIALPGDILTYKLGELHVKKLHDTAKQKLGNAFSIKKFHDVMLQRSQISLPALEILVNKWIESSTSSRTLNGAILVLAILLHL